MLRRPQARAVRDAANRRSAVVGAGGAPARSAPNGSSKPPRLPILILPGFLSSNTTGSNSQFRELQESLLVLGHPAVDVLPASTRDWLPTLTTGGSFLWYLERLAAGVQELHAAHDSQVTLVGVSAGGWLARLALGGAPYEAGRVFALASLVHTLVCLGTPHQSLEAYPFGRAEEPWICRQGGVPAEVTTSLQLANYCYPDADSLAPTRVVCVMGSAVTGRALSFADVRQVLTGRVRPQELSEAWLLQAAYEANCGDAAVDGDSVTPISTGMLPGAEQLVLPGVWHNQAPGKLWYGSPEVVEAWDKFIP